MAFEPLHASIQGYNKEKYYDTMWISMYPYLKEKYTLATSIKKVSVTDANRFIGDLAGLFKHVIQISPDFILPHILVNGYNSSCDYDGTQLEFILLDNNILSRIQTMLHRSKRLNKRG